MFVIPRALFCVFHPQHLYLAYRLVRGSQYGHTDPLMCVSIRWVLWITCPRRQQGVSRPEVNGGVPHQGGALGLPLWKAIFVLAWQRRLLLHQFSDIWGFLRSVWPESCCVAFSTSADCTFYSNSGFGGLTRGFFFVIMGLPPVSSRQSDIKIINTMRLKVWGRLYWHPDAVLIALW